MKITTLSLMPKEDDWSVYILPMFQVIKAPAIEYGDGMFVPPTIYITIGWIYWLVQITI